MSVSFGLWALILFPVAFIILMKWPRRLPGIEYDDESRVGLIRRYFTLSVDLFVGLIGVMPLVCMTDLFLEYLATGTWQWSFERDFFRTTDIIGILLILLGFYGIFYHIKRCFVQDQQTLGQYLLKVRLIPTTEDPLLSVRFIVAWAILAWWPFWPLTLFGKKQDYQWDISSRTKLRRVSHK